jgi:hypothetical protein
MAPDRRHAAFGFSTRRARRRARLAAAARAGHARLRRRREVCARALISPPTARKSDSLPDVSAAANQSPPDIDALQARLAATLVERDAAIAECDAALTQNDRLMHVDAALYRRGIKDEFVPDRFDACLERQRLGPTIGCIVSIETCYRVGLRTEFTGEREIVGRC